MSEDGGRTFRVGMGMGSATVILGGGVTAIAFVKTLFLFVFESGWSGIDRFFEAASSCTIICWKARDTSLVSLKSSRCGLKMSSTSKFWFPLNISKRA